MFNAQSFKSLPTSRDIYTLSLDDFGSVSPTTATVPAGVPIDLEDQANYHEGLLIARIRSVNGQGGTPTSPGAAVTFTLSYAFLNEDLSALDGVTLDADIATTLAGVKTDIVHTFPDSNSTDLPGIVVTDTDPFLFEGRYLYLWYVADAFAANALVDLSITFARL